MFVPPPCHPVLRIGHPPRPGRALARNPRQPRIVRPGDIGGHLPDPFGEEGVALLAPELHDTAASRAVVLKVAGPAKQIEVEPGPGVEAAQHPLPAVQYSIHLFRGLSIENAGLHTRHAHQLARARQASPAIIEPAPVGQLIGQRSRRRVVPQFKAGIHALTPPCNAPRSVRPAAPGPGAVQSARRFRSLGPSPAALLPPRLAKAPEPRRDRVGPSERAA